MKVIEQTLTSLEVAEMVGRKHYDVLRDIRKINEHLAERKNALSEFFLETTYEDKTGRMLPSYRLTKKGCELYATRMTGEKGTQFAVAYIERFNEMEQHLKQPRILSEKEQLVASMKLTIETSEEVKDIKEDVKMLKDTMRIDSRQESIIQRRAKQVVVEALGGKKSNAYKTMSRKVFSRFWSEFKQFFEVARYGDIPKKQFDEAVEWINMWSPDTSTRVEIVTANRQIELVK